MESNNNGVAVNAQSSAQALSLTQPASVQQNAGSCFAISHQTTVQDRIRMPPPIDVFPALFGALRARLAVHVFEPDSAASDDKLTVHSPPFTASFQAASDVLLTSLSASDPSVHRCLLQEIRHDASASKLQLLRSKRLRVRKAREAKWRQKQQLDAVVAAECDAALLDASTHDEKFEFFMTETHAKATTRLQTLFYECITEMKKALIRMESVAADTTEESESMVEHLLRRYEWQLFLARLQRDCGGDIHTSLLVPGPSCGRSSTRLKSSRQTSNNKSSVGAVLQTVIEAHGPTLENGERFEVRTVISLRKTTAARRAPEQQTRLTPSLHFGASATEMWRDVVGNMMSQANPAKSRRAKSASSSSTRRIRRLLPSKSAARASYEPASMFSTDGGMSSTLRQLITEGMVQFPRTACDVPLSSMYIQWVLPTQFRQHGSVADCNVYFDIAEYEQNFSAVMENYATSAALDETSTTCPVDHAVLASARRSLREISAILERSREQKESYSADTVFAARQMRSSGCDSSRSTNLNLSSQPEDPSVFARASVLQLVQTLYYSKCFLALLPIADVDILRKLYPSTLFGEGCVSTLYVPVISGIGASEEQMDQSVLQALPPSKVSMYPLDDHAVHELLLTYVARGRHTSAHDTNSSVGSNPSLTSLALSDAMNMLIPCRQTDSNQRTGARFCIIKNPRGLWKQDKDPGEQDRSEELQMFIDADTVFVECDVSSTQVGEFRTTQNPIASMNTKAEAVLEILGSSCLWRSCIASQEFQDFQDVQNNTHLCLWHTSVQRFLDADEPSQYRPNERRMKEVLLSAENDSLVERTKRIIQTSSSLLEELSSRHLPQSIKTFFEHIGDAASNRSYQAEFLGAASLKASTGGGITIGDLEQSHHELRRIVDLSEEIVGIENRVTRELQQLLQLTVCPGVEDSFIQHGFYDLEELQSDIRTRDLDLLLRLSQQKLQILERRRKEEEEQIARRIAPPSSLSRLSFHSALEQDDPELGSSAVYDVIHVMRKGRQSLLRQQRQQDRDGGIRKGSKRDAQPAHSLARCASDLAYRASPYEVKAALTTKYHANGGINGRKVVRQNTKR